MQSGLSQLRGMSATWHWAPTLLGVAAFLGQPYGRNVIWYEKCVDQA